MERVHRSRSAGSTASNSADRIDAVRALARAARLLERSTGELSLAHYRVLAAIDEGNERASRVARRLALAKPTVSAAVDALCRRGLITREAVQGDHRADALRLTAAGRRALVEVESAVLVQLEAVLARSERPVEIVDALARLNAGMDALAEERLAAREENR